MITEINVICVGDLRYRFSYDTIQHYEFDYNDRVMRIDFKDGSFIEFQKPNVICVEVNKDKAIAEDIEKIETRAYFDGQAYGWEEGRKALIDDLRVTFINSYPTNCIGEPELNGEVCQFSLNKVLQILEKYKAESEKGNIDQENE